MQFIYLFVVLLYTFLYEVRNGQAAQEDCTIGWSKFRDNCYKFYTKEAKYNVAKTYCASKGGHLVSFCSDEEWDFVTSEAMIPVRNRVKDVWVGAIMRGKKNMKPPPTIMKYIDRSGCTYFPQKGFIENVSFNDLSMSYDCTGRINWDKPYIKAQFHDRSISRSQTFNFNTVCKKLPRVKCFKRRQDRNPMIDMVKGNYLYLGKYGDNTTACMEACKKNDKCKTFSLFNNKFRKPFFRGICLGRVDVLDQKQEEAIPNVITGVITLNSLWCFNSGPGLNIVFDKAGKISSNVSESVNVQTADECLSKCRGSKGKCEGYSFFGPNYRRPFWRRKCFLQESLIKTDMLENSAGDDVIGGILRHREVGCFSIKQGMALFNLTTINLKSSAIIYLGRTATQWSCLEACYKLQNNKCRGFVWFSPSFRKPFWHNRCLGGLWDLNMARVPMNGAVTGARPQPCEDNFD